MVEPVTIILNAIIIINTIYQGVSWIKKYFDARSSSSTTVLISVTTYQTTVNEDLPKLEYEGSKQKKESLESFESNDHTSSSNSISTIGFVLFIAIVVAIVAFIIYRKRSQSIENQYNYRQSEKDFDSSPSPPTSETERHKSSIWSALAEQNLTIV